MTELIRPMLTVPFGANLNTVAESLFEVEAGLRGLGGVPRREELAELRVQLAKHINDAQRRDAEMQDENDRLRMMLQAVGVSITCSVPSGQAGTPKIGLAAQSRIGDHDNDLTCGGDEFPQSSVGCR